jgi:hypothetical protein
MKKANARSVMRIDDSGITNNLFVAAAGDQLHRHVTNMS